MSQPTLEYAQSLQGALNGAVARMKSSGLTLGVRDWLKKLIKWLYSSYNIISIISID